ncbi:hypothetical protein [Mucilaginibacter sp.]|uniref:hypothetical protein n=1 Tax=Mucilaginibacter sp. TaxID=1882438 RepID=UPI003D1501A2
MKILNFCFLFSIIASFSFGQTVLVNGTVSNQAGEPVPFAFIKDIKHNYATFSDSVGNFHLRVDPASSLVALAPHYKNEVVAIGGSQKIKMVMISNGSEAASTKTDADNAGGSNSFLMNRQLLVTTNLGAFSQTIKTGFNQEETRGSRYMFANWLPAFGINKSDTLLADIGTVYNYDKINGNLLLSEDKKTTSMIPKGEVKSFTLFDGKGHPHIFVSAPEINGKPYIEILVNSPKVKIYKKVDTKLVAADFHTDGVIESGHRYDEYVDVERYYVVKDGAKPVSISLRKKTIKEIFAGDADKFIADQGSRDVDEDYLADLNINLGQ